MFKLYFILIIQIFVTSAENLITIGEFKKAVTDNLYPMPSREQYNTIMNMAFTAGNITTKQELAMFLAQVLWESAGLQAKKEIKCAANGCPTSYRTGREKPGKFYYGRGYIQLTWLYNYEQCSKDLYGDNRLVDDPDLVSDTEEGAWGSAFWYWAKNCHTASGVSDGMFGSSTMAINGGLECKGPYKVKAFKRFTIYVKVLKAFKLDVKPLQEGCYPMTGAEASDFRLCDAVGAHHNSVGMYHWCNDNCNAEDPNCPYDMCECEGGNPVKKVKQKQNSTEDMTQTLSKVENNDQQSLRPRNSIRLTTRTPIQRRPEPKTTAKPEIKPEEKAEPKPEIKAESKPETKADTNVESKPDYSIEPIRESEPENNLFRYIELIRSSTVIPDLNLNKNIDSTTSTTTDTPDFSRTRLFRNHLGRLVRKRPVIRTTEPPIDSIDN